MTAEQLDLLLRYIDEQIKFTLEVKEHGDADHHIVNAIKYDLRTSFGLSPIG